MAHNSILKQVRLGLTENYTVPKQAVGVLYKKQRFLREIVAGEAATAGERMGGADLFVVEVAPQALAWRVDLPAASPNDFFSYTVDLRYAVVEPHRIVEDNITDTEGLITGMLEPLMRREARRYQLNQASQLEPILEDILGKTPVAGIVLETVDLELHLSQQARRRIQELNLPQIAAHDDEIPSGEPAYRFQVKVNVQYQVTDPKNLPADIPGDAEQQLWPRIQRALRGAARQHKVDQIAQAEAAMQDALDRLLEGSGVRGFGLEVLAADVTADLDVTARDRAVELANIEHSAAMERLKLVGLKEKMQFYDELMQRGSWAVLRVAVAKGEISERELFDRMNAAQREQYDRFSGLFTMLRSSDIRNEEAEYRVTSRVLETMADQVLGTQGPSLTAPPSAPQLAEGSAPRSTDT